MKTTNKIARFRGGAKRTDQKPRFDLIPFEFLESVAQVLSSGAATYRPYHWKRGQKDFFLDTWNHALTHLEKFKEGDTSEDHLAHLACNVAFMIWAIRNGVVAQDDFSCPAGKSTRLSRTDRLHYGVGIRHANTREAR